MLMDLRQPASRWWRRPILFALGIVIGLGIISAADAASTTNSLVTSWLEAQTNVHSWTAEVTQTRSLKTLAQPLTAQGRLWFSAPNRFRWELGRPAQTIAVRTATEMIVAYPRLKRAERYPLNAEAQGPWKEMLALLEAGFPQTRADLENRFKILSETVTNEVGEVALQPRNAMARRFMPEIRLYLGARDFALRATELQFADGSRVRSEFTQTQLNPAIDDALFQLPLPADYKITGPNSGR